jgi:NADPH-dependent glutamate synthase beta subunit-like oxidoreductase
VIVIGGGDTGADCIGTALRHGCKSLVNFEILDRPPADRAADNPWPTWPTIFRVDYAHEESANRFGKDPRVYCISGKEFVGKDGRLQGITTTQVHWIESGIEEIPDTQQTWEADLILLAMGFLGPEHYLSDVLGIDYDARSNYRAEYGRYATSVPKLFAAGDCRRGQSLVVRAINEGREAAREIDRHLTGRSLLP